MRLMLDLSKNNLIKATKDKSKLILITKQIIRNGIIVTNKYWVTPEQAKAMLATAPFDFDKFWKLAQDNKRDEALEYAKKHGVKWDETNHKQQNWLKAVKAVNDYVAGKASNSQALSVTPVKQVNSSPSSNLSTANSGNTLQELQNALDNRKNDWDALLKLAKDKGITWTESDNNDINKMRVSMAVSKFLKNNGVTTTISTSTSKSKDRVKDIKKRDSTQKTQSKQKSTDKSTKIPPKSERDKRIEKALSKMTKEDSRICKIMGMVGDDPKSTEYITKYLFPRYESSVGDIEKELKRQKEEEKRQLMSSKLKGIVSQHIKSEVHYWYDSIRSLLVVPMEDEKEWVQLIKEMGDLDTQDVNNGINPGMSTGISGHKNRVELFNRLQEIQNKKLLYYAFSVLPLTLPVNESLYYSEKIDTPYGWSYKVHTGKVYYEYNKAPSPYTKTQQKDPKMVDPFLFESLNFLQEDEELRGTAKGLCDAYLEMYTLIKKDFDDSPKEGNMTNYTNRLRSQVEETLRDMDKFNRDDYLSQLNMDKERVLKRQQEYLGYPEEELVIQENPQKYFYRNTNIQSPLETLKKLGFDEKLLTESLKSRNFDKIREWRREYIWKLGIATYNINENAITTLQSQLEVLKDSLKTAESGGDDAEYIKRLRERIGSIASTLEKTSEALMLEKAYSDLSNRFYELDSIRSSINDIMERERAIKLFPKLENAKNKITKLVSTKRGREVILNLDYFRMASRAVLTSNWKNKFWDWDYVSPLKMDFKMIQQSYLNGKYRGYTPSIQIKSEDIAEMKDRLSIEIASMKPSLNSSGKKTAQEIKDKLHSKYDNTMEMLKAYDLNSEDLMKENNVNCILSYAPQNEAVSIINKINKDWDATQHSNFKPKVRGVYKVEGLPVEDDFNKLKSKAGKSTTLYHGTGTLATVSIIGKSGQFKMVRPKVGRLLGNGIYLADRSSKSAQYISDKGFSRGIGNSGSLMLCETVLGNTSNIRNNRKADSVEALTTDPLWRHLKNNEWCVKNPKAVIPRHLVHIDLIDPNIKL